MAQPHLSTEGKPFGVIATVMGNNHYSRHSDTEPCFCRCCNANEMTVNDPFPGGEGDSPEGDQ